jgi:hypothetical protein
MTAEKPADSIQDDALAAFGASASSPFGSTSWATYRRCDFTNGSGSVGELISPSTGLRIGDRQLVVRPRHAP